MGPGILVKALLQGSFSLMVFGWAQIILDIQPLLVMISGEGHLHGFSHSYLGASLIAVFSALSGKYLSEVGLHLMGLNEGWKLKIAWHVALLSAFIGSYSHVVLDSIMHSDVEPFFPFTNSNKLLGLTSTQTLHQLCLYSAAIGVALHFVVHWLTKKISRRAKR